MAGRPNTVQKEANLIKQKYIKSETAALNIKNQLKSSIESEKIEELKSKPMQGNFCPDIERPSVDKER
jgi:anti-sigma28 factor (negative regulator of flagellin synthesis)